MQLESVGNLDEQLRQIDFRESVEVDQAYLDKVGANRDGEAVGIDTILKTFQFDPSKDDFTTEVQSTEFLTKWLHISCKRHPSPPSRLVELYRRFR